MELQTGHPVGVTNRTFRWCYKQATPLGLDFVLLEICYKWGCFDGGYKQATPLGLDFVLLADLLQMGMFRWGLQTGHPVGVRFRGGRFDTNATFRWGYKQVAPMGLHFVLLADSLQLVAPIGYKQAAPMVLQTGDPDGVIFRVIGSFVTNGMLRRGYWRIGYKQPANPPNSGRLPLSSNLLTLNF
jgi:hypothetical protein